MVGLQCERMDDNVATYVTRHPLAKRFCQWYLRWLQFPMFDHHIAVSDYVAGELRDVAEGHDVRRGVWVMPHGRGEQPLSARVALSGIARATRGALRCAGGQHAPTLCREAGAG
ncbi:MAG: hypothetical protein WDO73_03525 [Ignavibacteriota bacterium]